MIEPINWNPLILAAAGLLSALALALPGILAWLSSRRVETVANKIQESTVRVEEKADHRGENAAKVLGVVSTNSEIIKGHVNSEATALRAQIDALQKERDFMRTLLAEKKEEAALLAQSLATVAAVAPIAATVELTTPAAAPAPRPSRSTDAPAGPEEPKP